jgi:hypothetical protein
VLYIITTDSQLLPGNPDIVLMERRHATTRMGKDANVIAG